MAIGTIWTELDLDTAKFRKKQDQLLKDIKTLGTDAEHTLQLAFQNLGVTSDKVYQGMAAKAQASYERIARSAKVSADEQFRAQSAAIARINALNQEITKNPLYETLGIRSRAAIEAQRDAVIRSYETIKNSGTATAQDLVNIERAKNEKLKQLHKEMVGDHEMSMAAMTRAVLRLYAAYYVLSQVAQAALAPIKMAIQYLSTIETANLGIAASFVTGGKFIDRTTGKVLEGSAALAKAQVMSKELIQELQYANLQTIATLDQLIVAYQATLPVALARGFNVKQVKDFTLAMVQAAGAIGLSMDQMAEETRSLLTASINPRNSRIATVLGLRNEDIAKYKSDAQGLFDFLMDKLDAYKVAGIEAQNTWAGLTSNMKDIMGQFFGRAFDPLFEAIKYQIQEWINKIVTLDEKTKTITWNKSFLDGIETIKGGISSIIAEGYRMGMMLDKIGGTMTSAKMLLYGPGAALGIESSTKRFEKAAEQNIMFQKRFLESDKALMDMAMREQGYKPATKETKGAIEVKTEADQTLYYYKVVADANTTYQTNKQREDEEARKKREQIEKQITEAIRRAQLEREEIGRGTYEKELLQIEAQREKYEEEIGKNKKIDEWYNEAKKTAKAKLDEWIKEEDNKSIIASYEEHQKALDEISKAARKANEDEFREREKAAKDFEKITADTAEFAETENQRAINKIIAQEAEKLNALYIAYATQGDYSEEMYLRMAKAEADIMANAEAAKNEHRKTELSKEESFYAQLTGFAEEHYNRKLKLIEAERKENEKKYGKQMADEKATQDIISARSHLWDDEHKNIKSIMSSTEEMFGSAAAMFDKESSQYENLMRMKQVMHTAELAMNAARQVANYQALQEEIRLALAKGASATAAQAQIPIVGFAMAAAMVAFLSSVFSTAGISFGSAGVSSSYSAAYGQDTTVFGGNNGEASASIDNSLKILNETYDLQKRELVGIHDSMIQLNNNITGIVKGIVGINAGQPFGAEFGQFRSGFASTFATLLSWNYLGPIIDKIIGVPLIGGLANRAANFVFGSSESWPTASGIWVSEGGRAVRSYTSVHEESSGPLGGIFGGGGSSDYEIMGEIDQSITNLFSGPNGVYTTLRAAVVEMATSLGGDVQKASDYIFEEVRINLMGKNADEIAKIFSAKISEMGDKMASAVMGDIVYQYQKVGEGALETVTRLYSDKIVVAEFLDMTHKAFTGTAEEAIALSEALINLAGDLEKLKGYVENYYDKFFSEAEKQARLQVRLNEAMSGMNLVLPDTRAGYRAVVEALDLTTTAGQEAYITMLQMAESANDYYSYLEEAQEEAIESQKKYIETLKSVSQTIDEWLNNLSVSNLAPVQSEAEWTRQYMESRAKASAVGATAENVSDYLNFASKYLEFQKSYGTATSYQAIYEMVTGDVKGVADIKNTELAIQQAQLDALNQIATNTTDIGLQQSLAAIVIMNQQAAAVDQAAQAVTDTVVSQLSDLGSVPIVSWVANLGTAIKDAMEENGSWLAPGYATGGLGRGLYRYAEKGDEWIVPTYEPERSNFLKTVGADTETLGKSIAKYIISSNGGSAAGDSTIDNHIYIDGKEICHVVTRGMKGDSDLINATRRAVN